MAYRTFHQEKYYDAPNIEGLPNTLHALNTIAQLNAAKQRQAADLQTNYKIGVENGYFPQIQKQLNMGAQQLVNDLGRHYQEGGQYVPNQIKSGQAYLSSLAASAKASHEHSKAIQEQINLKKTDDPYYNATADEDSLKQVYRQDMDTPEKIEEHLNTIRVGERSQDYDIGKMTADFVKEFGTKEQTKENNSQSGIKSSSFRSGQFVNDKGVPDVTNDHVEAYFKKHPILYKHFSEEAQQQIADEIKSARANDEEWTRGKTDEQLFSDISHGNSGNPNQPMVDARGENGPVFNSKGKPVKVPMQFGDRVSELAKQNLKQYENTKNSFSIDASNYNEGANYGMTNKTYNAPVPGFNNGAISGPSWHLYKKTGTGENILPQIPASMAKIRYNNDTGKYEDTGEAQVPFSMTSFQWGPVDASGKPIVLKDAQGNTAKDIDDQIRIINEKPLSDFKPGGIVGTKIIMNGRSIDKANTLNLAYKAKELNDLAQANPDNPQARIDANNFSEALANMQQGKEFDSQMFQKFMGTDFVKNQSFATSGPDDPNVKSIEGQTGMNVYNPKLMTDGARRLQAAIDKRVQEASKHVLPKEEVKVEVKKGKGKKASTITVTSQEDYDNLSPGATYIDPSDGKTYIKK